MQISVTKGTVSYRKPHWRGFVRWRVYPDGATAREIRAIKQRPKQFTLTEYRGKELATPTEGNPNLGRRTAERALAVARKEFLEELEREYSGREDDPAQLAEQYARDPSSVDLRQADPQQMAMLPIPVFAKLVIDGLEDGSIQKDGHALAVNTIDNYRSILRTKIERFFPDMRVRDLAPGDINRFKAEMIRLHDEGERGFSQTSRRKAYILLQQVYGFAELWDVVPRSPFAKTAAPRQAKPNPNVLDSDSLRKMVSAIDAMPVSRISVAFKLAMEAGLRRSEICGLKWVNVDLGEKELRVRTVVLEGHRGVEERDYPKSHAGYRTVPLTTDLGQALGAWRELQSTDYAEYERPLTEQDFVTGDVNGRPMSPNSLTRAWRTFSDMNGLRGTKQRPRLHDLRHEFVTLMLAEKNDVKSVSAIAGHASAAMTLDQYADALPNAKRAAIDKADAALWPSTDSGEDRAR